MKLSAIFYSLVSTRVIFAYSNSARDLLISAYREDASLETRSLDKSLVKSLLPRTSNGKARTSPSSPVSHKVPSPREGVRSPGYTNQGLQLQPTSVLGRLGSAPTSHQRAGGGSVNSSPIHERPPATAGHDTIESEKRPGHSSAYGPPTRRQRSDPAHRGDDSVLRAGLVQQHTSVAPNSNRDDEAQIRVQRFIQRWHPSQNNKGRPPQESAHYQNSPETRARLQATRQQLRAESDRLWQFSGPRGLYQHPPERRLTNLGEGQNARAIPQQPGLMDPNHPVNQMSGMAARIAAGQPRDIAGYWQARESRERAAGQGVGHAAAGAAAVAHQGQVPVQNQGIRPNRQASPSPSATSTQNHFGSS